MKTDILVKLIEMLISSDKSAPETNEAIANESAHPAVGKVCIVRTYSAGVHFGTVESVIKCGHSVEVALKDSRRIWKWVGAFTLSELSENGFSSGTRISESLPLNFLQGACEIIPAGRKFISDAEVCHE